MAVTAAFSLRTRLLLWLVGPLLVIGFLALWDVNKAAWETANEISDRLLAGSALAISEQIFVNEDDALEVDVPYVALQMLTSSADDRVFYRIESLNGDFVTGYRLLDLSGANDAESEATKFFNSTFRGSDIRIATFEGVASSSTKSLRYRVGVAETTNARAEIAQRILVRSALRQAILIAAAVVLVWIAVTSALKPLSNLKKAIDRRNPEDMRPINHKVPLEVESVVERINDLLARFSLSIQALRNFTSNTSHQFRTPLALIHTHLELASRAETKEETAKAIENANKAVADAERIMSQMLLMSRLDTLTQDTLSQNSCDLTAVARGVCEEFVLRLSHQNSIMVDLGFHGEDAIDIQADKILVQEIIRNLVDNAIKHSGEKPKIDVSVFHQDGRGVLSVRDHGVGFDLADISRRRADGLVTQNTSSGHGAGIGLSIVQEIVLLLNGRLNVEPVQPGVNVSAYFKLKE